MTFALPRNHHPLASALFALLTVACTHSPIAGPLPEGLRLTDLGPIDGAFAWHPGADRLAVARDGLWLVALGDGSERSLLDASPSAVVFSPDGVQLAAVLPDGDGSKLVRLDVGKGARLLEATLAGRVRGVAFAGGGRIVTGTVVVRPYTFGTRVEGHLTVVDAGGGVASEAVFPTMVNPGDVRRFSDRLFEALDFAVSPLGDEVVLSRFHDPPAVAPYSEIVLRHLASGAERSVARVAPFAGHPQYAASAERVAYGDGAASCRWAEPWEERGGKLAEGSGRALALSPGAGHLLADGQLRLRDGRLLALREGSVGGFSPKGDSLLIRTDGRLFLLAGLPADPAPPPAYSGAAAERVAALRRWRAEGLITPDDYRTELGRIPAR